MALSRYFFHATAVRMHSDDYNIEDDGSANDELNAVRESGTPTAPVPIQESRREDDEKTDTEDEDSELRDWFQIQRKHTAPTSAEMSDSATDPDSDHEDFEEPIDVDDEWLSVDIPEESTDNEVSQDSVCPFSSFVTFLLDDKISRSWQFQSQKYISCRFDSMTISDRHP